MIIAEGRIDGHEWMRGLGLPLWKLAELKELRRGARLMVFAAQETADAGSDNTNSAANSLPLGLVQTRNAEMAIERVAGGFRFYVYWDIANRRISASGRFTLDGNTVVFSDQDSLDRERNFRLAARYAAWIVRRHKAWGVMKANQDGINAFWHGVMIYRDGRARRGESIGPKGPNVGGTIAEIVAPWINVDTREAA